MVMDLVCLLDPAIYDSRIVLCLLTTHKLNWLMGGAWTDMGQGESDFTKTSCAYVKCRVCIYTIAIEPSLGCHATTARIRPFSGFMWST